MRPRIFASEIYRPLTFSKFNNILTFYKLVKFKNVPFFSLVFKQVNHNRENPDAGDPVEPNNDESDSSDGDSEEDEETDEANEANEANEVNDGPSEEDRVPGAAILTSFVPLQLVAHLDQGQSVVVFDNELCNSPLSGEFLGYTHLATS
jgi:hypothetical protein